MAFQNLSFEQPIILSTLAELPTLSALENGVQAYVDEIKSVVMYAHPDWYRMNEGTKAQHIPLGVIETIPTSTSNSTSDVDVTLLTANLINTPTPALYRLDCGLRITNPGSNDRIIDFYLDVNGERTITKIRNIDTTSQYYIGEFKSKISISETSGTINLHAHGRSTITQTVLAGTETSEGVRNRDIFDSNLIPVSPGTAAINLEFGYSINSGNTNITVMSGHLTRMG